MGLEDYAQGSVLLGNNAFVNKLLSNQSFSDHSSSMHGGYYCDEKKCMVPFTWEEEPGTPKQSPKLNITSSPFIPPPATLLSPLNELKRSSSVQPRSFFRKLKPWRTTKPKNRVQIEFQCNLNNDALHEFHELGHRESCVSDCDDIFSSPGVSESLSQSSARSSSARN
ncbi:hypothetical protein RIF29_14452 [Crotalaria pallida]|uniref:Uncharacterized protein n=1 Tax=Crotalaria pallida TaxID=3830 RepID=A0AAN9FHM7_CROPI